MITDSETNCLYLPDTLAKFYPDFFASLSTVLNECNIRQTAIPNTKDIWAVDYMPIQIGINDFVQFIYNPDYLQSKKWLKTIPDVDEICRAIGIKPAISNIVLDGGNVVRTHNKVILCDKIFLENPDYTKSQLVKALQEIFKVESIYFIPQHPKDFIGHADGMLRFLNENTVIVNDYSKENNNFTRALYIALHNAGLDYIEIPYNPYGNSKHIHANGIYVNYLQMANTVIIPTFGMKEDEEVIKQFEQLFYGQKVATVNSNEIAVNGGILNCISWNILT